jgi:mono/diheme cytochrome c family protein
MNAMLRVALGGSALGLLLVAASEIQGQAPTPRRVTMEDLHRGGGVPRGWRFQVPAGEPGHGRQLFADLECYKCHTIKDGGFPPAGGDPRNAGPELTGMGGEHPAEYIAESILAPNHVIVIGPGHTGPDGLSTMPSFSDSLSVTQWLDLVAYLKSLTEGGDAPHTGEVERERIAGNYRIRLVYTTGHGPHGAASHGPTSGHHAQGAPPAARGHLMVFITDREFDEPVPYLPVTATITASGRPPQRLRLAPMLDEQGFHYGADVGLPAKVDRVTLSIGGAAMQVAGSLKGKFKAPVSVVFDWGHAGH